MNTLFEKIAEFMKKSKKVILNFDGGSLCYEICIGELTIDNLILFPYLSSKNKKQLEKLEENLPLLKKKVLILVLK